MDVCRRSAPKRADCVCLDGRMLCESAVVVGEESENKRQCDEFDALLNSRAIMRASMRHSMAAGSSDLEELQSLMR